MANYYLNLSYGKVGKTLPHLDYITANGKYAKKNEEITYNSHNMPSWVKSPKEFWELADNNERINGRTYREVRISLPEALSKEQNIKLLNKFLKDNFKNHYYSAVIHDKETNPMFPYIKKHQNIHAHIMFSPRVIDNIKRENNALFFKRYNKSFPERGGALKDTKWNEKDTLLKLRKDWELTQNKHLEINNINARVSCETLEKQRQIALEKGDLNKYNQLNRLPINVDYKVLNKKNKSAYERELINQYVINSKVKSIKDEIYFELEKEKQLNKQILNKFNDVISDLENTTDITFTKVLEYKNKIEQNNILLNNLKNLDTKQEIYSNLIDGYKDKVDELNSILNNQANFDEQKFFNVYAELKNLEASVTTDSFEKEKEVVFDNIKKNISELENENEKLNNTIKEIYKSNNNSEFIEKINDYYNNIDSQKSIDNLVYSLKEIQKIKNKLNLIDTQLENSKKTTLNILSGKKYIPLEKEIKKLRTELNKSNYSNSDLSLLKELLIKKEKQLKDLEIKYTKNMDKFIRIKQSYENKLKNNKKILNVKLQALNTNLNSQYNDLNMSNREVRLHLSNKIEKNKNKLEINNAKIKKLKFLKNSLNKDVEKIKVIAYLALTKGKYGKLQKQFDHKMQEIENLEIKIIKLKENKFLNVFALRKLEKQKFQLQKEAYEISQEYKTVKSSVPKEKLIDEIVRIKNVLDDKSNKLDKELKELYTENMNINIANTMCFNLIKEHKDLTPEQRYDKSLDFNLGQTTTKHTGAWDIQIQQQNEKVIRL